MFHEDLDSILMVADGAADERGPYRVFLAQGTLYLTGMQLANVTVVLPLIAAEYNLLWVAGLVYAASAVASPWATHCPHSCWRAVVPMCTP